MIYLDLLIGFLKVGCFAFGGAYGAILGKAIYNGNIDLVEAIRIGEGRV